MPAPASDNSPAVLWSFTGSPFDRWLIEKLPRFEACFGMCSLGFAHKRRASQPDHRSLKAANNNLLDLLHSWICFTGRVAPSSCAEKSSNKVYKPSSTDQLQILLNSF